MARYGLIIVCTKAPTSGTKSIPEKLANEMSQNWSESLSALEELSFTWPGSTKPRVLFNPTRGGFTDLLDNTIFEPMDEMFFYYFGHSYPVGPSKVAPAFSNQKLEYLEENDFEWVFNQIFRKNIEKVYAILDTCHSGMLTPVLDQFHSKIYCMMAAENGYTRGAFSKHLLNALASVQDDVRSLMYDNQAGGLTFNSLFEYGLDQMASELVYGEPQAVGSLGRTLIRKEDQGVPPALRTTVPERSTYRRLHYLLKILSGGASNIDEVMAEVKNIDAFVLKLNDHDNANYISASGIHEYLRFLSAINFLISPRSPYQLSDMGKRACSKFAFNEIVVDSIMDNLFPKDLGLNGFKSAVWELLGDGSPADPLNVSRHLRAKGYKRIIDPKSFKFAFKILAYSGVFRRSTDALFPIS
ncbi:hypothetical protein OAE19_02785 [Porticoccaceae bacterium]|nr:hypothetical protein [Porticoccaceae bacterium]